MVSDNLIRVIRRQYRLEWDGIHGVAHWGRVLENGLRLATKTKARPEVVWLFAVFHDSQRWHEGRDPEHGKRGAEFAARLRGIEFDLPDSEFRLLHEACARHTRGRHHPDVTVETCWDADRLDLGRVGIKPKPAYLCTEAARRPEVLAWAYERSVQNYVAEIVTREWDAPHPS